MARHWSYGYVYSFPRNMWRVLHACFFRDPSFDNSRRLVRGLFHSQGLIGHGQSVASSPPLLSLGAHRLTRNKRHRQIANDPENYEDPAAFRPERFLGAQSALDPHAYVFGFGRRGCPGIALAGATVYAFMSAALATLNFAPLGPEGMPSPEFISGTVR